MRYALALLLLTLLGTGAAQAQTWATQAEAYNHAATVDMPALRSWCINSSHGTVASETVAYLPAYPGYQALLTCSNAPETGGHIDKFPAAQKCIAPEVFFPATGACELPCPDRADQNFSYGALGVETGDRYCHSGCEWTVYGVDGGFTPAAATGYQCSTMEEMGCDAEESLIVTSGGIEVCRANDTDEDGIPDFEDEFPNDPSESTDTDGDGIGDNGDHKPDDPTDGKDEDEEGGDEGDNVSTGGGDCNTPPNSSGDGILTQIAYQTWKTRCAIEAAKAADGSLKVSGNGTGGAIAIAGGGGTDLSIGDTTGEDIGNPSNGGEHPGVGEVFQSADLSGAISAGPDEGGFGLSETCPLLALPNLEFSFGTLVLPWADMCDWLAMLGGLIAFAGMIQWAFIVGRIGT